MPAPAVTAATTGWPASRAAATRAPSSTQIQAPERWPAMVRTPLPEDPRGEAGAATAGALGAAAEAGGPAAGGKAGAAPTT